jgi:iron complex outermembrane recepter protein
MKKNKLVRSMGTPKIGKSILKLSTLTLSMMCLSFAHANEAETTTEQATKVAKVTVTGSSIKGVAAQSSSPITIIRGEDLAVQGVTTVEEALSKVSSNQAGFSTAQNVGSSNTSGSTANLRALGSDKTLILLNGRRLAYSAFSTSTTNLNIIPMAMIDRIEVLRDGASAVYGADAIAGVINFITKSEYEGLNLTGTLHETQHEGGERQQASIFGGYGNLEDHGFNLMGVLDYRKTNSIHAQDRKVSRRGGVIPELGIDAGSASGFPANLYDPKSGYLGNPYPDDCNNIPWSSPDGGFCYLNTQALIAIQPQFETISALGKGTLKLTDTLNATAEYVFTRAEVSTSIAPDVYGRTVTLPSTSQYYPGNGITPGVDGPLSGDPVQLYLRSQAGNRESMSTNDAHRFLVALEGEVAGWDVNAGVAWAKSDATDEFTGGYLHRGNLQIALNEGRINPFGPARAGDTPWESFVINGETNVATLESTTADITVSRPIFELPAGEVGFALGASFTTQDWQAKVNSEIVRQVPGSGIDPNKPISKGDRDISAIFTEFHVPILPSLEAQIAARYDEYSDFGDTFNPKVGLRWEPMKEIMFRASYSTGFRAPSLYEINAPISETYTGAKYNDPVLCPGGVPIESKYQVECNTQFKRTQGGSPDLQPEESTSFTAGFVFEPIKNLVFTADYFNIEIDGLVGIIGESTIFNNPERYADRFVRDEEGRIKHIRTTLMNSGGLKTEGVDVSLNYLSPKTSTGRFGFGIDGTYVMKLDYQSLPGSDWNGLVGLYVDPAVVRWKHVANINWSFEDWKMIFEQQYVRGYEDYSGERDVADYTLYNFATTYKGFKNVELTGGIRNIFDTEPSASDVMDNFQYGYDPRYADPTGRTFYVRGTYKF